MAQRTKSEADAYHVFYQHACRLPPNTILGCIETLRQVAKTPGLSGEQKQEISAYYDAAADRGCYG